MGDTAADSEQSVNHLWCFVCFALVQPDVHITADCIYGRDFRSAYGGDNRGEKDGYCG